MKELLGLGVDKALFYPMAAMVFYIWLLALYNLITRMKAVKSGEMSGKYFVSYNEGSATEKVIILGRHFDNQFQLPMLYLISCMAHIVANQVNLFTIVVAWIFFASRLLHTREHLGRNHPLKRAKIYAIGWMQIILLWGQLLFY